jgi:Tol biopolymer transport system component
MRNWNRSRFNLMIVVIAVAILTNGGIAQADFVFGEPVNMGPILNSSSRDEEPGISSDGLSIYFCSQRSGGRGGYDMWVTTRATTQNDWGPPVNLGPTVNSSNDDFSEDISADGLELYFGSNRPGSSNYDIWVAKRATTLDDWTTPVNLGSNINSSSWEGCPAISDDGLELYFWSNRSGGIGGFDIWVSRRATKQDEWGPAENVGPPVNSSSTELCMDVSPDGLVLISVSARPGSYGGNIGDLWMSRRSTINQPWAEPVNLGPKINTSGDENGPCISADGSMLYYSSNRPGGSGNADMWQASIEPVVDFNGDGFIDTDDLLILIDNWQTDNSLCDIGPMPWGDGVVDMNDLTVFIEYWEKENMPQEPKDEQ